MIGLLLLSPFVVALGLGFWWMYGDELEEVHQ